MVREGGAYGALPPSEERTGRRKGMALGKGALVGLAAAVVLLVVCVDRGRYIIGTEKGHGESDELLQHKATPHDLHFVNVSVSLICSFLLPVLLSKN